MDMRKCGGEDFGVLSSCVLSCPTDRWYCGRVEGQKNRVRHSVAPHVRVDCRKWWRPLVATGTSGNDETKLLYAGLAKIIPGTMKRPLLSIEACSIIWLWIREETVGATVLFLKGSWYEASGTGLNTNTPGKE